MRTVHGVRWAAIAAAIAVMAWAGLPAAQADESDGRIELTATLEPADLAPGQSGTLKIKATLFPKLHIYAEDGGGYKGMVWKPVEADGVTYHVDGVKPTPAPHELVDPTFGDKYMVYEKAFELVVKVDLAKSVKPGTAIGLAFDYSGCTDEQCYQRIEGHAAMTKLGGGGAETGGSAGNPFGVPFGDGAPGAPPVVGKPKKDGEDEIARFNENGATATLKVDEKGGKAIVTFIPDFGHNLYWPGNDPYIGISVEPVEAEGVRWGKVTIDGGGAKEIREVVSVEVEFERDASVERIEIKAGWQSCNDENCLLPSEATLVATWGDAAGGGTKEPSDPAPAEGPKAELILPVIEGDKLGVVAEEGEVQKLFDKLGWWFLGPIFLFGVLLAFTPCVLPIIPITVAVVTGGRTDLPKSRVASLLLTYITGLALAFGAVGIISAFTGASLSTAFQIPAVIWSIGGLFALLSVGMLGIVELQPPQWLMKVQGGAQQRGGSFVGAFLLGALAAVIASPCTGPFIVGMALFTAQTGDAVMGFLMFMSMGLGMGAVFFAFGSLNFAMRPGPWMVWVRYGFGMILFGGALFYVANNGLITPATLFIVGFAGALLAWLGVSMHLQRKEGESSGEANMRGAKVALMFVVATGLVAFFTRPPDIPDNLKWTKLEGTDDLVARVNQAVEEGRPTAVKVTATWCAKCIQYDKVILDDDDLRLGFSKIERLKIDLSRKEDNPVNNEIIESLGIPLNRQPFMVFIDRKGNIRRGADVTKWYEDKSAEALQERLDLVLKGPDEPATSRDVESASK